MKAFTLWMLTTILSTSSAFTNPVNHLSSPAIATRQQSSSSLNAKAAAPPVVLVAAAAAVPNPFKKLPWNQRKEREREMRRLKLERASLHRELGIVEDASYEEIVAATDALIARAGEDLKQKIRIEVAKDKILQIRLNERLAGLQAESKEARAMSTYEVRGVDEDEPEEEKVDLKLPNWMQGLVVKPDEAHAKKQIRIWGIITAIGVTLPPVQDYLNRFTWLVCVAQLTFRGMASSDIEGGGMGMSFGRTSGGSHRKVAFLLGFATWTLGSVLVYSLMPAWARGQRWTSNVGFTMKNIIFGVVCAYLQPYKGGV